MRFCRRMGPSVFPMKGAPLQSRSIKESTVEDWANIGLSHPINMLVIASDHWKSEAFARLHKDWAAGGATILPFGVTEQWAEHMTSEHRVVVKNRRGMRRHEWRTKNARSENHWWDCHYMNLALAEYLGLAEFSASTVKSYAEDLAEQDGPSRGVFVSGFVPVL